MTTVEAISNIYANNIINNRFFKQNMFIYKRAEFNGPLNTQDISETYHPRQSNALVLTAKLLTVKQKYRK